MHKCLFSAILWSLAFPGFAQKVPVKLSLWPAEPVVFEAADRKSAVLLFADLFRNEATLQAVEVDTSFAVLRQAAAPNISGGELDEFIYVTGMRTDSTVTAFFLLDETTVWGYTLHLPDFVLQRKKILSLDSKEYLLGGFVREGRCGMVVRRYIKKEVGQLMLYDDLVSGQPPREVSLRGDIRLLEKGFRPVSMGQAVELPPAQAAEPDQVWFGKDAICFASTIPPKVSNDKMLAAEITTVRWSDLRWHTDTIRHTEEPYRQDIIRKAAFRIFDDKLFSLFIRDNLFSLKVFDLESKQPRWTYDLAATSDTMHFFSSPVRLPKGFRKEKEYMTGKGFVTKFLQFEPFIQVRRTGADYVLAMGGSQATGGGGGPVFTPGMPGVSTPFGSVPGTAGTWGWRGGWGRWGDQLEFTPTFYLVLHGADQPTPISHTPRVFYQNTLYGLIADKMEKKEGKRNGEGLFLLFGRYYYGYYFQKEHGYFFSKLDWP